MGFKQDTALTLDTIIHMLGELDARLAKLEEALTGPTPKSLTASLYEEEVF